MTTMSLPAVESRPLVGAGRLERAHAALRLLVEPDEARREALRAELFAPDFRIEATARGGCQVYSAYERGEFRRGSVEIVESLESGPRVLSHVRLVVERRHEVDGVPVSQVCHADGIITYEFTGDRIVRAWSVLRWQ